VEIVGTVTDSVTGLPLCNALVSYFGSSNSARTDVQGKYRIPCASPGGSQSLFVTKSGYKYNWVVVAPFPATGSVTKDIALEPSSIPGLFNTGVDACGRPLADSTIGDPHYALISVPSGTTGIRVRTSAGGFPVPPYMADNSDSAWIGPNGDAMLNGPTGQYMYRTTFSLTGLALSSVSIAGKWSTDNDGVRIVLNGTDTGNPPTDFSQYSLGFAPFTISSGFVPGLNTLDFVVNNDGGPTALRVEMTSTATT
jgi:hypothetical protein